MACFRLFTFLPERPERSFPRFRSCIARSTFFCAFRPYFLAKPSSFDVDLLAAKQDPRRGTPVASSDPEDDARRTTRRISMRSQAAIGTHPIHPMLVPIPIGAWIGGKLAYEHRVGVLDAPPASEPGVKAARVAS